MEKKASHSMASENTETHGKWNGAAPTQHTGTGAELPPTQLREPRKGNKTKRKKEKASKAKNEHA